MWLAACAAPTKAPLPFERDPAWPRADVLLLGEQHDADEHHRIEARLVTLLAQRGRLAAVAMEMAERGHSTAGLPRTADAASVQAALAWDDKGWPWKDYGPAVMAAVQGGVPVVGADLPRSGMRDAMRDTALDTTVPPPVRARLTEDVRTGHCDLLPPEQLPAMTRMQIARDRTLADSVRTLAAQPRAADQVVLLITGANHADASRGVPLHLRAADPTLRVLSVELVEGGDGADRRAGFTEQWATPAVTRDDPCAGLAKRLAPKG